MVMNCGDRYAGSVEVKVGTEQFIDRAEDGNAVSGSSTVGAGRVGLYRCDECNAEVGGFQFPVDT